MNTLTAPFQTALAGQLFVVRNRTGLYLVRCDGASSEWGPNRSEALTVGNAGADTLVERFEGARKEAA